MELKRFFVEEDALKEGSILIDNQEYNHIVKVMRFKKGYKLIVCTGDGYDYYCEITDINDREVICRIEGKALNENNAKIKVNLYAAAIKQDNYELTVQKATELGVYSITPVITQYVSEKNLRMDRLLRTALEASKQCERASLTIINEPIMLKDAINRAEQDDLILIADEKAKDVFLKDILCERANVKSIAVFIGPEGGFSDEERTMMNDGRNRNFTLGKRILRAETASLAVLANIMYELDR